MRGPATATVINGGGAGGSNSSGSRRRRVFALVLAVGVVFTVVRVGVSVRWSSKAAFAGGYSVSVSREESNGGGGGGGTNGTNGDGSKSNNAGGADRADRSDDGIGDDSVGDTGGVRPPDARWVGRGKRAYAVSAKKSGLGFDTYPGIVVHIKPSLRCSRALVLWYTHTAVGSYGGGGAHGGTCVSVYHRHTVLLSLSFSLSVSLFCVLAYCCTRAFCLPRNVFEVCLSGFISCRQAAWLLAPGVVVLIFESKRFKSFGGHCCCCCCCLNMEKIVFFFSSSTRFIPL